MDTNKTNYTSGINYAINQIHSGVNEFNEVASKIKNNQGNEAYMDFTRGYYEALVYFTHAISHYRDNPKHLEEIVQSIEQSKGEELKNVFLMGVEYYKNPNIEINPNQKKK